MLKLKHNCITLDLLCVDFIARTLNDDEQRKYLRQRVQLHFFQSNKPPTHRIEVPIFQNDIQPRMSKTFLVILSTVPIPAIELNFTFRPVAE